MALAKAMQERGHETIFFNVLDRERTITGLGLGFVPYGFEEYPAGSLAGIYEKIGRLKGVEGFQYFIERMLMQAKAVFRDLPDLIVQHNIGALVIDQLFAGGGTLAQHLRLPYVSLANALAVNFEPGVPPPTLPWEYEDNSSAEEKNRAGWNQIAKPSQSGAISITRNALPGDLCLTMICLRTASLRSLRSPTSPVCLIFRGSLCPPPSTMAVRYSIPRDVIRLSFRGRSSMDVH